MANPTITEGSPFDGFFEAHLPSFFFEKFTGADLDRIEALFKNLELVFDNLYQTVKEFPNENGITSAEAKYLFQLGKLIGLQDITDLSIYLDSDGNVTTITQEQFDVAFNRQKSFIANAVASYLLKGTIESIIRILQSHGIASTVRELWTEDTINGPFFELDNSLVKDYGDAIIGSVSGDVYQEEQPIDILSELSADVPSASAVGDILQYEQNNYDYKYLLDDSNNFYFKTSSSTEISGSDIDTWYEYDSSVLSISGDIQEFKILNGKIFLRTSVNDFAVLDYQLDDATIIPDFSIDDNNCYFFDFIESNGYFFLDRGSTIEVRDITNYQKLANAISKPSGNIETISQIIRKRDREYLIINNNKKGYILNVDTIEESYNLNTPDTIYDLLIGSDENFFQGFSIADDEFSILKYDDTTNILKVSFLNFDEDDILTSSSIIVSSNFTEINDFHQYSERVLILGDTTLGIYNLIKRTVSEYDYVTTGYDYKQVFVLDKFYFKRFNGSDLDLTKIIGWNSFREALYKSHYFDLTVNADVLSTIIDIGITSETLKSYIDDIVELVKPIHTEFNLITILAGAIEEEITIGDDDTSLSPIVSGGPTYTLSMLGKYNGIHPWKRSNNQPLKYNNDGQDGRPSLKYGRVSFEFGADVSDTDLDNLIYYNTDLP